MLDIGQQLKKAREAQGLTLTDLTERTMIPKKYLTALETEQFTLFPGEVYFKGALRKYAAELGLDAQALLDSYHAAQGESADSELVQRTMSVTKPLREKPKIDYLSYLQKLELKRFLPLAAIILVLGGAIFLLSRLPAKEPPQTDPPSVTEGNNGKQPDESIPPETEPNIPEAPTVLVQRDPKTEEVHFIVSNTDELTAELSFSGPCWLRAVSDGERSLDGTFRSGQPQVAKATEEISIRIGNPPAVSLAINGQPVELPRTQYAYTLTISKE